VNNILSHKNFDLTLSNKKTPCLWESGGVFNNDGSATIICGKKFEQLKAVYIVPQSKSTICGNHALIPIKIGCHIIEVTKSFIFIYKIIGIYMKSSVIKTLLLYNFDLNNITIQYSKLLKNDLFKSAQNSAIKKSKSLFCVKPFYVIKPKNNKRKGLICYE